jgi:cytochrome d ubiquinol oxidase subunit I
LSLTLYLVIYGFLLIAYIRTLFVMANRAVILEQADASITDTGPMIDDEQTAQDNATLGAKL